MGLSVRRREVSCKSAVVDGVFSFIKKIYIFFFVTCTYNALTRLAFFSLRNDPFIVVRRFGMRTAATFYRCPFVICHGNVRYDSVNLAVIVAGGWGRRIAITTRSEEKQRPRCSTWPARKTNGPETKRREIPLRRGAVTGPGIVRGALLSTSAIPRGRSRPADMSGFYLSLLPVVFVDRSRLGDYERTHRAAPRRYVSATENRSECYSGPGPGPAICAASRRIISLVMCLHVCV